MKRNFNNKQKQQAQMTYQTSIYKNIQQSKTKGKTLNWSKIPTFILQIQKKRGKQNGQKKRPTNAKKSHTLKQEFILYNQFKT